MAQRPTSRAKPKAKAVAKKPPAEPKAKALTVKAKAAAKVPPAKKAAPAKASKAKIAKVAAKSAEPAPRKAPAASKAKAAPTKAVAKAAPAKAKTHGAAKPATKAKAAKPLAAKPTKKPSKKPAKPTTKTPKRPPYLAAELGQPTDHKGEPVGAGQAAVRSDEALQDYTLQLWRQMQSGRVVHRYMRTMERAGLTADEVWTAGVAGEARATSSTPDEMRRYRQKVLFRANLLEAILSETVADLRRLEGIEPTPSETTGGSAAKPA